MKKKLIDMLKGKTFPIGTVSTHKDGKKYKKLESGKWQEIVQTWQEIDETAKGKRKAGSQSSNVPRPSKEDKPKEDKPNKVKNKLLASASSNEDIKKLIGRFYYHDPSDIELIPSGKKKFQIKYRKSGKIVSGSIVTQKGMRYRFEGLPMPKRGA